MFVKDFESLKAIENGYLIKAKHAQIKLIFMTDDIVRVRVHFDQNRATSLDTERSYALVSTAWEDELDDLFKDERQRIKALEVAAEDQGEHYLFDTGKLKLIMHKSPVSFELWDKDGCVYSDLKERAFDCDHLGRLTHYSLMDRNQDHFFGFGEKTGYLDKKGSHLRMSPKDAIGHDPETGDPMYKHIPMYMRVNEQQNKFIGLFYNNSHDAVFDLGQERSGYFAPYCYYQVEGGDIDCFLIYGPSAKEVVDKYTFLTGRSAMLPMSALEYTASSMFYTEHAFRCDEVIDDILQAYSDHELPIGNFWLASGYSSGEQDNLRYTFNWNTKRFPDPKDFAQKMADKWEVNVIPNLKPGVLMNHPYKDFYKECDALIKAPEYEQGEPYYIGRWWGGPGYFIDFTNPKGREAWTKLLTKQILNKGYTVVWNDNCEYDGIEDRNAVVSAEGKGGTMAEYKIIQSNMMAYTAKQALQKFDSNLRPYIINRAGYAGIQRYAQVWGGDNLTDWRTLKFNIATILGMGLSGVSNMGCDVGGFAGHAPEAELLLRWIQNGIFQPRFTINSANDDNTVTEPWMYPQYLPIIKAAFDLRLTFINYMYSLMREANLSGIPIWRPCFMEFPDDLECLRDQSMTFMFGPSLLVANVLEKGATTRRLYLPKGKWYDINEDLKEIEGGRYIDYPVNLTSIPMFVPENAILPSCGEITKADMEPELVEFTIALAKDYNDVDSNRKLSFNFYQDDGSSNDYLRGNYSNMELSVHRSHKGELLHIDFEITGDMELELPNIMLHVISKDKSALFVKLDQERVKQYFTSNSFGEYEESKSRDRSAGWFYNHEQGTVDIMIINPAKSKFSITVSTQRFDLIGMGDE